MVLELKSSTIQ